MRDCQAVETAEGTKEKVAVIVDVVVGREQHRIELAALHVLAHFGHALRVFLGRESVLHLFAVAQANQMGHVFDHLGFLGWTEWRDEARL